MSHHKQLIEGRVVHKSTGGVPPSIPQPVDPVGNAAPLKPNTVAPVHGSESSLSLRRITETRIASRARKTPRARSR
jgi:hypothetical protein